MHDEEQLEQPIEVTVKRVASDEHGEVQVTLRVPAVAGARVAPLLMQAQRLNKTLGVIFLDPSIGQIAGSVVEAEYPAPEG